MHLTKKHYIISDNACLAMMKIINDLYSEIINVSKCEDKSDYIVSLLCRLSKFTTKILLPDEYKRDFSQIWIENDELKIKHLIACFNIYNSTSTFPLL